MLVKGKVSSFNIVISDTCCLISFESINKLKLLQSLNDNIYITPEVLREFKDGGSQIPDFVKLKEVQNKDEIKRYMDLGLELHEGEASSIALYKECTNPLLLTDDPKARNFAENNNINYTTTLNLLVACRELGFISSNEELHACLDDLIINKRRMPKDIILAIKQEHKTNEQNNISVNDFSDVNNLLNKKTAEKVQNKSQDISLRITETINYELIKQKATVSEKSNFLIKIFEKLPKWVHGIFVEARDETNKVKKTVPVKNII